MLGPDPERRGSAARIFHELSPRPREGQKGPVIIVSRGRGLLARLKGPLEREGYPVRRASETADALAVCTMFAERLALVVIDWIDPAIDADRLLMALHRRVPGLPVVLSEGGRLAPAGLEGLADRHLVRLMSDLSDI